MSKQVERTQSASKNSPSGVWWLCRCGDLL